MLAKIKAKARHFSTSKQDSCFVKQPINSACRPQKSLGQNFLHDKSAAKKIIMSAEITSQDIVVEIGPGLGFITFALAKKAKKVLAIEKDRSLAEKLKLKIKEKNIKNIEIIEGDFLKIDLPKIKTYKVVANLPFNIASACVMKFLEAENQPSLLSIVTQKEVGQKMTASPPDMSKLSVFSQMLAEVKIIGYINKSSFWPQPKVESAIVKMRSKKPPRDFQKITCLIQAGFQNPRKTILNNLSKYLKINKQEAEEWIKKAGLSPSQRPGALLAKNWIDLAEKVTTKFNFEFFTIRP